MDAAEWGDLFVLAGVAVVVIVVACSLVVLRRLRRHADPSGDNHPDEGAHARKGSDLRMGLIAFIAIGVVGVWMIVAGVFLID